MRLLLIASFVCALAASGARAEQAAHPPWVAELEATLVLPERAGWLSDYTRWYAIDESGFVRGVLVRGENAIHVVPTPELPMIMDGGCGVIEVSYDVERGTVSNARCHGEA